MIAEMVLEALDKRARRKAAEQAAKAYAKGLADARSWYRRRHDAKERGEPFDEPFPGSDEDTSLE